MTKTCLQKSVEYLRVYVYNFENMFKCCNDAMNKNGNFFVLDMLVTVELSKIEDMEATSNICTY